MKKFSRVSLLVTIGVIFGAGLVLGLWMRPTVRAPAATPAHDRPFVVESGEEVVKRVYREVSPAVVNVAATKLAFNYWMQVVPQVGQGTGFIFDDRGYILTNNHVISNAEIVEVTFVENQKVQARVIGKDAVSDLAVIKVNPIPGMISARLGDSDKIEVGQRAIAIGNPFGLQHTVTAGFVSAIQRDITIGQRTMTGMFQTDAAINPGNSGGPLINSNSEVFAINTAIFSQTGSFIGIGLAVPINRAKKVAQQLITHGRAIYPWLGIQSHLDVDDRYADRLGLPRIKGVLVCAVAQDSPAARAGLRGGNHYAKFDGKTVVYQNRPVVIGGDFIVEVDGTPTATFDDCENLIMNKNVGDPVLVKFIRDNKAYQVSLTLAADPRVSRQP